MPAVDQLSAALSVLRAGGLVAFPTETVYGLGGDAANPDAVRRIFAAKGRPTSHPLIVHIAAADAMEALAREVPDRARVLARRFWPGPLTLVLPRGERVSRAATGGQDTVALRVPDHPIALALLERFGGGVAAPSANRFGQLSPTTAAHVQRELGAMVELVLDGGPCAIGIESTIVDLTRGRAVLLRAGGVPVEALEAALGEEVRAERAGPVRAPGQLASHYAPRAEVVIVEAAQLRERAAALRERGARVGALLLEGMPAPADVVAAWSPADPRGYARVLYGSLRALDDRGVDVTLVVPPETTDIGAAVADRLDRAAAPRPPAGAEPLRPGETAAGTHDSG